MDKTTLREGKKAILLTIAGAEGRCATVSGLEEDSASPGRSTGGPVFSERTGIVLADGVLTAGRDFFDWLNKARFNPDERRDVVISQEGMNGGPGLRWGLSSAWPTDMDGLDRTEDGGIVFASLTLACESLEQS